MTMPSLARFLCMAGNDFELYSVIENLALSSDNGRIRVSDLPEHLFTEQATDDVSATRLSTSLSFAEVEKRQLLTQPGHRRSHSGNVGFTWDRPHYAVAENEATWH